MDEVRTSTVVYTDQSAVYDFLVDFPGYEEYSDYVTEIEAEGDGGSGPSTPSPSAGGRSPTRRARGSSV
jgi:hypothetical protein